MSELSPTKTPSRELPMLRLVFAIVLIASFALKLQNLGHPGIKGLDESFHAVVATNLLKHPLTPTLIDKPYLPFDPTMWQDNSVWLHKPILPMWQMAMSMAIGGINTMAMRMPSAILGTLSALLTYLIARRWIDERAAFVAGTLMVFCPMTWMLTHGYLFSDHVDISLLFWTELGVWLLAEGVYANSLTGPAGDSKHIKDGGTHPNPLPGGEGEKRQWISFALFAGAGVAQGLAFLSKTFPALVIFGLAILAAVLLPYWRQRERKRRIHWIHLALLMGATLLVAGPWALYTSLHFPVEFFAEYGLIFKHLSGNVEGWDNPWDRILFDYWVSAFYVFYPACLAAALLLVWPTWREKSVGMVMVYAWMLGVLIPHLLSASKTPSMTLIGWPPVVMLLGAMVSRATRGNAAMAASLAMCALAAVAVSLDYYSTGSATQFFSKKYAMPEFGVMPANFELMLANRWVLYHLAAALAAFGVVAFAMRVHANRSVDVNVAPASAPAIWDKHLPATSEPEATIDYADRATKQDGVTKPAMTVSWRTTIAFLIIATLGGGWMTYRYVLKAVQVTQIAGNRPDMSELGNFIHDNAPENAVILIDLREKLEEKMLMFYAGRTCYGLQPGESYASKAEQIRKAGGRVFLVTHKQMPGKPLLVVQGQGRALYELK